ncbi:TPM domain-containing protein [Roseovarius sp. 2305UL8-3]|uniref:TPM domain-containing protein n=1 Tax=Roseovarius conchicola TaxID=3121636 RepID=UPI0035299800
MTRILVLLFALLLPALPLTAQIYPDYDEVYVNDFGNLLTIGQERSIRDQLKDLRNETGIEFTVVTIGLMSDYGHVGAIEPFATGLFNYWGIGNSARNDGVMMLVSRYDREMRIEVGSGYGAAKDAPMKRIIDKTIIPYFKQDDYGVGIEKGVAAVIHDLTGAWPGEDTFMQKARGTTGRVIDALGFFLVPIGGVFAGFGYWFYRRRKRYRPRICPNDGTKMQLLAEHWDDQYLKPGQVREEQLESVDYDVWECPECAHRKVEAYEAWSSKYGACRECSYRALEGESTTLQHATTSSTGRRRIDYNCHNCHATYAVEKVIPKVSKSSSSSSSGGGSSFGGGSSSGGGASGSW